MSASNKKPLKYIILLASMTIVTLAFVGIQWLYPQVMGLYYQVQGGKQLQAVLREAGIAEDIPCTNDPLTDKTYINSLADAVENLENAISYSQNLAQAYLLLGNTYCALGEYNDAIKSYEKFITLRPDSPLGNLEIGHALYALEEIAPAIKYWQSAGVTGNHFYDVGNQCLLTKQRRRAYQNYQKAALMGLESDALYGQGLVLAEENNEINALSAFRKATLIGHFQRNNISDVFFREGLIYQKAECCIDFSKALEIYDIAIQKNDFSNPNVKAEAYYKRGEIYDTVFNDRQMAIQDYQIAILNNSSHYWASLRLTYLTYWNDKNLSAAENAIFSKLSLWPKDLYLQWPYRFLGHIYIDGNRIDKAIWAYQKALSIAPESSDIRSILALLEAGKTIDADLLP